MLILYFKKETAVVPSEMLLKFDVEANSSCGGNRKENI
jgi:hypothetical protein